MVAVSRGRKTFLALLRPASPRLVRLVLPCHASLACCAPRHSSVYSSCLTYSPLLVAPRIALLSPIPLPSSRFSQVLTSPIRFSPSLFFTFSPTSSSPFFLHLLSLQILLSIVDFLPQAILLFSHLLLLLLPAPATPACPSVPA
ncbi:hypothetical protein Pcinc_019956 [Petrolisthes cinctipes]|uniref:Transmembrane protein n=1 Tax=Petrolisthes cinctipes TaxID=88211 RepID=A0AAE1KJM5_PETCI|nr:hypothetical protein Pcinc_019956 [Petrolisthes cinctipes]